MVIHGYSTLTEETPMPGSTARRLLSPTGLRNDDLGQHLAHLQRDAMQVGGAALAGVLDHLRHVHWHYVADADESELPAWLMWAASAQAVIRTDAGALLDPDGHLLLGPDATGRVPVHAESVDRATRVRTELASSAGIVVPPGALPVRSTRETILRHPDHVGRRAIALVLTADFALSVLEGRPLDWRAVLDTFPAAFADRTPAELALFHLRDHGLAHQLKWGYEGAAQLLAVCGLVDLGAPTDLADQGQIWNASVGVEERAMLPTLALHPTSQVCDEWERIRSLHHAASGPETTPEGIDPEIVRQRYRALEWLTGDQPWDDVDAGVPCWA